MLKPTHYFKNSNPRKHCTHVAIKFTIEEQHFDISINQMLQEIEDTLYFLKDDPNYLEGKERLSDEKQITRKAVEEYIRKHLKYKGYGFDLDSLSNEEHRQLEDRKDKINLLKEKLFPDWFGSNSLKFIREK